jgi:hypothetical protein
MEQWAMPYGRFAVGPSRQPVLPDAIQPMPRLTSAGVSAMSQLTFLPIRVHTPPHVPGSTRESVVYDARPEPRRTFE